MDEWMSGCVMMVVFVLVSLVLWVGVYLALRWALWWLT